MNNKTLVIVFASLIAIYFLTQMGSKKEARSFKTDLVSLDTASITKITFKTKQSPEEILLQRNEGVWNISKGNITAPCDAIVVNGLLDQVADINSIRPAATKAEKWVEYEVDDKTGSNMKFYAGDKLVSEFVVGRLNIDQRRQTMESFLRLPGDDIVYATNSHLPLTLQNGFNGFRNKTILNIDPVKIYQISYNANGAEQTLDLQNGNWNVGGVAKDSTTVVNWISKVAAFKGSEFQDDVSALASASPIKSINIKGQKTAQVRLYQNPGEGKPFIIHSSQNDGAYFLSDSTALFQGMFEELEAIF